MFRIEFSKFERNNSEPGKPPHILWARKSISQFLLCSSSSLLDVLSVFAQHKIHTVAINPTGEWLAFGAGKLGQLLVWEWQSETYVLKQQGHFFDVNAVAYSPDGQLIATGADDGKVKLWNATSGFCFVTFSDHSAPVSAIVFSHTGTVVFSASHDGTVRAYDLVRYRNFRIMAAPAPVQVRAPKLESPKLESSAPESHMPVKSQTRKNSD